MGRPFLAGLGGTEIDCGDAQVIKGSIVFLEVLLAKDGILRLDSILLPVVFGIEEALQAPGAVPLAARLCDPVLIDTRKKSMQVVLDAVVLIVLPPQDAFIVVHERLG